MNRESARIDANKHSDSRSLAHISGFTLSASIGTLAPADSILSDRIFEPFNNFEDSDETPSSNIIHVSRNRSARLDRPESLSRRRGRPQVRVSSPRRISTNGEHNAFTDLCRYGDRYYLTFRSCPDGHGVHPTSSIIVMVSDDCRQWKQAHRFSVKLRDTRDPHFLVFQEKLFVYTGTWHTGESTPKTHEMNQLLGYAVWTEDGKTWSDPTMLEGTYGHYIWRAASHNGKAYICARRKNQFAEHKTSKQLNVLNEAALLESEDGLIWRKLGLFQEHYGDETAFLFQSDGTLLAVSRTRGNRNAQLGRMKPPYHQSKRVELDRYIGGPLLAKWGDRYLVGGRNITTGKAVCSLYWLHDDRLTELAELPSGGDCSYPGFVQMGPGRAVVSYYSSHERDVDGKTITAVYLVDLEIE